MKDRIKKVVQGKGFYVVSALGLLSAVVAVAVIYRTAVSIPDEIALPKATTVPTQQAQIPQYEVPDPRTVTESTTGESTIEQTTSVREESTAIEPVSTTLNEAQVFSNDGFIMPAEGEVLKEFSPDMPVFDETMNDWRVHKGVDFLLKKGEDVLSVGNGQVKKIISDPSFGYIVEVDYGSFTARNCGLEQGTGVHTEQIVKKGDVIGKLSGVPCESKMESHLHFEVMSDSVYKDPIKVLGE